MEDFGKVREMTPEEAKNLDSERIEYIALSSGEIIYIKKSDENGESKKENEQPKEEELKEIQTNEKEEGQENINNEEHEHQAEEQKEEVKEEKKEIHGQNQELIELNQEINRAQFRKYSTTSRKSDRKFSSYGPK